MKPAAVLAVMLAAACGPKTSEFSVGFLDSGTNAEQAGVVWLIPEETAAKRRPPLESMGERVRARVAAAEGRKVWATLKAEADGLRFTSYDCVLNGASGIWYLKAALKPDQLFKAESVAREMRAMAPVFARGRPIPLPFEPPTKGWMARAWTYRGRDYLVLVNRTRDRQWKVPEAALAPTWRPLFEVRRDPRELLKKHMDAYYLKPYQVLVLESRLRPKRLLGR